MVLVLMAPAAEAARRAPARVGVDDPRYAALIMNPETGEIYHSKAADARRYPASLTKMMTLYLLFEDLQRGKVTMNTRLKVSDYATTMPATKLSVNVFDTLPVETAIKSLVVLSANDAAVVVAENLDGSVQKFAQRMTNKARALGMNNTVFRNPNGLPNDAQYTTARDMAKLGIALKRDFPQYYPYFSTRQFSWKGATYYTHNRVMLRYAGTDGIKTGFINKSGFNVVTSCTRGGRPLIGVVMGGGSGGWRDTRMIQLLDQGYKVIASRGQKTGRIYAANLPTPQGGQVAPASPSQVAASAPVRVSKTQVAAAEPAPVAAPVAAVPVAVAPPEPTGPSLSIDTAEKPTAPSISVSLDRGIAAQPAPFQKQVLAPVPVPAAKPQGGLTAVNAGDNVWGIQVGAFSSQALAEQAVRQAYQQASPNLQGSRMAVVGSGGASTNIHRARLENLSENQAKKACEVLISNNSPCFIFRADSGNL